MLWERMLPGTLLMWGITKTGKMAINCHPPSSAESLPTCFRYPGQPPCKAEHVPSHALTESCENKAKLVLNLKLQVSSPEEVIKNLAHVPMWMLLSPCPGGPHAWLCSLSLCLVGTLPAHRSPRLSLFHLPPKSLPMSLFTRQETERKTLVLQGFPGDEHR